METSKKYMKGDTVYIAENGRNTREATIVSSDGTFYTIRFREGGGTRLRGYRLYPTEEEAGRLLPEKETKPQGYAMPLHWKGAGI